MRSSQRIVLNTAAAYARSVLAAGLALFSSRWVLNALGQTDFGLFSVVGSLIVFVTFFNNVMAGSAARHFAYAIGQGDIDEVNKWFNTAFSIHLVIPVILIILGWPVGEYCIRHVLTIPPERVQSCAWVFRLSLISSFISMASVPFVAMFRAKQIIAELSVWEMLQAVLAFSLAWLLTIASGDRLLFFATGMVAITVFIQTSQVCRGLWVFRECRVQRSLWFDAPRFREIFSFASWTMIGVFGGTLRNQGSSILLNLYFGPNVNAAYAIANQVSTQTGNLSAAMFGAFSPEITASEGRGDRTRVLDLSHRVSKLGTLLVLFFAVPLIVEMQYVLELWLHEPPSYTALFCQLMLVTFLLDKLTAGYMSAVNAHGKIAAYQATLGTILVMTLPLAWLFLHIGYPPTSVGFAFIMTMTACSFGRVLWMRYLFNVPVRNWLTRVLCPCLIVAIASALASLTPGWLMPPSFLRLFLTCTFSATTVALVAWFFALDPQERTFFIGSVRKLILLINPLRSSS